MHSTRHPTSLNKATVTKLTTYRTYNKSKQELIHVASLLVGLKEIQHLVRCC